MSSSGERRVLAIGDIHGFLGALQALETIVPFHPDDLVVVLGDFIDRGPRSREVMEWLVARHESGGLVAILGNHEEMMLRAAEDETLRESWLQFGGTETLASYGVHQPSTVQNIPVAIGTRHWRFLAGHCLDFYQTETHFFVHAGAEAGVPLQDQHREALRWKKFSNESPHVSGKTMICGHTPQPDGKPTSLGFAICIDTGIYAPQGWLTCLDVATGVYWQANQQGATRRSVLPQPG